VTRLALPRVVLLTDRRQLPPGRSLRGTVRACAGAGLGAVVVREHDLAPADRRALVADLADLDGLLVLSSRIDDPAAAGVHLAAAQPRGTVRPGHRFGRSCHDAGEVGAAATEGADWATLSPFAASASKPGHGPPVPGPEWEAATGAGLPVLALGGVDADNAGRARDAGAHGVAVMGAVMRALDPAAVVRRLLAAVR
jgi:thiamine-phosphate pyrophosphorylase